jgi:serine/threonine-protein kinase
MIKIQPSGSQEAAPLMAGGPLQVAPNCWLVGHRNPASLLQCNTYLRIFDEGRPFHVCADPGSQFDFAVIEGNVRRLIGDLSEVHAFTLNHQDPDVVANSPFFCEANPRIETIVTEEVWRLVQHLLFKPGKVRFANVGRKSRIQWTGGKHWQLVPTPFCHFRGAMAFYDPEIRTLFSGDLFGGLNQLGRVHLFAEQDDWAGVAQFHQIYMPTREALRYAVRQIRALRPAVEIIAPQHGHVITGERVGEFLDRIYDLEVGTDLLAAELDDVHRKAYGQILSQLFTWAAEVMGRGEALTRLANPAIDDDFQRLVRIDQDEVRLEREGYSAVARAFDRLTRNEPRSFVNYARSMVLAMCTERGVPIPPIGAGVEEGVAAGMPITPPKAPTAPSPQ